MKDLALLFPPVNTAKPFRGTEGFVVFASGE